MEISSVCRTELPGRTWLLKNLDVNSSLLLDRLSILATISEVSWSPSEYMMWIAPLQGHHTQCGGLRLQNDLYCFGWGVDSTHSLIHCVTVKQLCQTGPADIINWVQTLKSWQPLSTEKNWSCPGRPLVTSDPVLPSYSNPTDCIRRKPCNFWNSSSAWTRPWIVGPRTKLLPIICMPATNKSHTCFWTGYVKTRNHKNLFNEWFISVWPSEAHTTLITVTVALAMIIQLNCLFISNTERENKSNAMVGNSGTLPEAITNNGISSW